MGLYKKICDNFLYYSNFSSTTDEKRGLLAKAEKFLADNPLDEQKDCDEIQKSEEIFLENQDIQESFQEISDENIIEIQEEIVTEIIQETQEDIKQEPQQECAKYSEETETVVSMETDSEDSKNEDVENEVLEESSAKIDEPFIFFKNFANEVGLQKVVVLIPYENNYQTIFSYGVESYSREKNVSTLDFWNGTLDGVQWQSYSGEKLCPFYQLFSQDDVQQLKHLHIKRFEIDEDTCAIILILEDSSNSLIDLETIDMILPNINEYLKPLIEMSNENVLFQKNEDISLIKDKINSEVAKFNMGFLHTISLQSIFRDLKDLVSFDDFYHIFSVIYHKIISLKNERDIWYFTNELEIRNVIFAQTELDLVEYTRKINNLIKSSFSIENPTLEILYKGNALESEEIFDFLFSEN